jgi:hypothetical protein
LTIATLWGAFEPSGVGDGEGVRLRPAVDEDECSGVEVAVDAGAGVEHPASSRQAPQAITAVVRTNR